MKKCSEECYRVAILDSLDSDDECDCGAVAYNHGFIASDKQRAFQQWISVDDRLPEGDGEVLVWDGEDIHACFRSGQGDFLSGVGSLLVTSVTHWMPLPEPPTKTTTPSNLSQETDQDP